jgi:peptide/nickel transport system substrate-binding protein
MFRALTVYLSFLLSLSACAPGTPTGSRVASGPGAAAQASAPQKALVIGFSTEPARLDRSFNSGSGVNDWAAFLSGFLAYINPDTSPSPYMASELPSIERGTWKLLPDGGMETTYRLRQNVTWHDGAPVTARDFAFAYRMRSDPELPTENRDVERRLTEVATPDDYTLVLQWRDVYIWAGQIAMPSFSPMPMHILQEPYSSDKTGLMESPYWRTDFVGAGPYRLESWQQGAEMSLRAHETFFLGKPKIDRIVVKFITDANTIVANMLSGTVDIAFHSSIGFSQNQALQTAGWTGTLEYWQGNPRFLEFQTRDWGNLAKPVLDRRVRQALLYGFDRKEMIDGLYAGRTKILHYWLPPDDPANPAVERAVTKYDFNRTQAEALLQEAGWTRGPDGLARNAEGEALHIPILNQSGEIDQLEAAKMANDWKAFGVSSDITVLGRLQQGDTEFRSKLPGASFNRINFDYETFPWVSAKIPTPQNRWAGNNRVGYVNLVVDESWTKAMSTLDLKARESLFVETFKAMTADAVVTPTHLQPRAMAYRTDLVGPRENYQNAGALVWNIWDWHWR